MESITIKDVARLCGVGVSTVSRAINNHPDINPETKEKIMQVISEHHYIPNNSARNLKRQDSKTVAILMKGIANPFFHEMIKILEYEVEKKKYSFLLHHVDRVLRRNRWPHRGKIPPADNTICALYHRALP